MVLRSDYEGAVGLAEGADGGWHRDWPLKSYEKGLCVQKRMLPMGGPGVKVIFDEVDFAISCFRILKRLEILVTWS